MYTEEQKQNIKAEIEAVKQLGEKIGYGNMMEIASALWRKSLKEKDYPENGAFVPTIIDFIMPEERKHAKASCDMYDGFINW